MFGTKYVTDHTAYKVANSETMNVEKNPRSFNSSDEKRFLWIMNLLTLQKKKVKITLSKDHNKAVSEKP